MTVKKTQQTLSTILEKTEQSLNGLETALENNVGGSLLATGEQSEADENNIGQPEGWVMSVLGDIISVSSGNGLTKSKMIEGTIPVYGGNGVTGWHNVPNIEEKTIVIGRVGFYCGSVHVTPEFAWVTDNAFITTYSKENISKNFLYKLLVATDLRQNDSGSAQPVISGSKLYPIKIPLPPLAEQTVIAQTLDTLLAQVDNIKTRLDAIPNILKTFRQSVLAAAVSGKLTEAWRDGKKLDANSDLEKECGFGDRKPRKIEATSSHDLVTNEFPENWAISTFTNLYKFIDYRGKTPKKSESGKRLYTAKNIKMGRVVDSPIEYLSEEDYVSWMTRGFSKIGDIFFVTEGHTMGCVALNEIGSDIALAQRTLTLQPFGNLKTKFHYYFMLTDSFQKLVDLNATGTAAKGIKAAKFRGLPLPFPSYEEQTQIVHRVEELFAFADQIEQQVKNAQGRVNNLTQSILAKAFRGELTAQWRAENPDLITGDNSAEVLLAKIQEEREKLKPKKATKKKSTVKKTSSTKTNGNVMTNKS
jgi:type I restriction enzyme S subunit